MDQSTNSSRSLLGEECDYSLPNHRPPGAACERAACPQHTPVQEDVSLLVPCKKAMMMETEQGGFCRLPTSILLEPEAALVSTLTHVAFLLSTPCLNMTKATHQYTSATTPKYYTLCSASPWSPGEQWVAIAERRIVVTYYLRAETICRLGSREEVLVEYK